MKNPNLNPNYASSESNTIYRGYYFSVKQTHICSSIKIFDGNGLIYTKTFKNFHWNKFLEKKAMKIIKK